MTLVPRNVSSVVVPPSPRADDDVDDVAVVVPPAAAKVKVGLQAEFCLVDPLDHVPLALRKRRRISGHPPITTTPEVDSTVKQVTVQIPLDIFLGDLAIAMKTMSSLFAGKQKDLYDVKDVQLTDDQNLANMVPAKGIDETEISVGRDNSDQVQMCFPVAINVEDRDLLDSTQVSHCQYSYVVPFHEVKVHAVRPSVVDIRMCNFLEHPALSDYTIKVKVKCPDSSLHREFLSADSVRVNISNEIEKDDLDHVSLKKRRETLLSCFFSGNSVFSETNELYSPNSQHGYQSRGQPSGITFTRKKRTSMCHSHTGCEEDATGHRKDMSKGNSSYLRDAREEQSADIGNNKNHTNYTQAASGESYFDNVLIENAAKTVCGSMHDTPESFIAESPCMVTRPSLTTENCQVSLSSKAGHLQGTHESNYIDSYTTEPSPGHKQPNWNGSKQVHGSALTTSPVGMKVECLGEDATHCFSEASGAKRRCASISDSLSTPIGLSSNAIIEVSSKAFKSQDNVSSGLSSLQGNKESEVVCSYNPSNAEVEVPVPGQNKIYFITGKQLHSSGLLGSPNIVKTEQLDSQLLEANGPKQCCRWHPSPDDQALPKDFNSESNVFPEVRKLRENIEVLSPDRSIADFEPHVIPQGQGETDVSAENQLHVSCLSAAPFRIKVEPLEEDANDQLCDASASEDLFPSVLSLAESSIVRNHRGVAELCDANASEDLFPSVLNLAESSIVRNHWGITGLLSPGANNLEGNQEIDDTFSHQILVNEINMTSIAQKEVLLIAKNQLHDQPLPTFPTRVKFEPSEVSRVSAEKLSRTSMSSSLGSPVAGNPCTATEFLSKATVYDEKVSPTSTNLKERQESSSIRSSEASLDVPVLGLEQMSGNATSQLPESNISTSTFKVKVEPWEESHPNIAPGTSHLTFGFLSKAANQFPDSSLTSLLNVKVEQQEEAYSVLVPETNSMTSINCSVALNLCPTMMLSEAVDGKDILPRACSTQQNQENIACLSPTNLSQANLCIVGQEQNEVDAKSLNLNSEPPTSFTVENYEPLGSRHADIFPENSAVILSTSNLVSSQIKEESKSSETAGQNLCKNSLNSFSDSDMLVGEIKREILDELSIDTLDHVPLKDRIKMLLSRLGDLKPAKNSKWFKKTRADCLACGSVKSAMVKARSSTRQHKRKRTATDSVETALEEDAPGLLQGLIEKGIDLGEIKLYGCEEDDDALDMSSAEDSFEDFETVISKLFSERPTSLFKFASLRSNKGSKAVYCLACLLSLIEQTRYLQFRKCPVEWGWCRDLQSFIFVFKMHHRIVLERPEYGYATYFFELVESFPVDWQIKRLVTTMKLASCGRGTLIENKALMVGEDLTEGEARVLEEYGWRPNSGLGSMLNYCDRVVHDRRNEWDSSDWRSKIRTLLMNGYDGGCIVMADLPKKVVEYAGSKRPKIKMEI